MVEVLAMLAIAGIIGSAGVGGYTVAMKKHRANELIHEAAGRALAVSQQLAVGRKLDEIDFGGYPNNDTGHGKFSDKPIPLAGGDFFKIPITGMDQNTCEQLKVMAGGSLRRVDCKDDGNGKVTADLIYQKDLSATAGTIPGDTSGSSSDGNTTTRSYDNDREGCEENGYQYCSNNICITKEEVCETGSALCADTYPGTSENNTGGYAGEVEGKTCRCPSQQAFNQNDKKCIPACSGHGTLNANEDCVCQGGYTGVVCETVCSGNGTLNEAGKCECDANWYGPLCDSDCDGFRDRFGNCVSCGISCGYEATLLECQKCDHTNYPREMVGNYCALTTAGCNALYPSTGGFRDNYVTCVSCSYESGVSNTSKDECDKCSNREMITDNGKNYCALTTAACNALYSTTGGFRNNNGTCYSCSDSSGILVSETACSQCATSSTPRFRDNYGNCYSCSYSFSAPSASKDECDKCSNREMVGNRCALTTAACNALYSTTGGFRNNNDTCYSCSDSYDISTSKDECDKCGALRYHDGTKCRLR
ncbi:MAG: hypothetical protein J6T55_00340 [Alphaproteobacteria bacterium]|nr:hypothetical protein [Alphaproteobacteria bacterium]